MTTLSMLAAPASDEEQASVAPLPWRQMVWVTWRQHRLALSGVATLLGVLALGFSLAGVHLHHVYSAAIACRPASSFACGERVSSFNNTFSFLANGVIPQAVPVLIGAFLGAPVIAREFETGTYRFAWTQGFGRRRWTLAKLVLLAATVTAATAAISVLVSWYYGPYFATGNQSLSLSEMSPFNPGLFDLRGVSLAAWTLTAFAVGALAGTLVRRVVPAIAASLALYAGLAFGTGTFLREHYLTPLVTSRLDLPGSAWVINQQWLTRAGRPISETALGQILQQGAPAQFAGKGGVPKSLDAWQYLVRHGYTQLTTYQPASRFWPFQWIEGGWLLALSVLLIATTAWLVRRRAA
ncbi:MAG TPA: hypothetical protein VNF07_06250 [Acidimicrobiales bacterium]|nr:hypothetical protein [Acidimicrobiales bacterium]